MSIARLAALDAREAFDELDGYAYDRGDELATLSLVSLLSGVYGADDDGLGEEDEYEPDCNFDD